MVWGWFADAAGTVVVVGANSSSSAAIVLHYLIRLEPFTTLAVRLQGGFFDHADRLFHSIGTTYDHATTNSGDVKELPPELYYLPEALSNALSISGMLIQRTGSFALTTR